MYTGIIHHKAKIIGSQLIASGLRLTIESQFCDFSLGESIAIDGICITVSGFSGTIFHCELSPETLRVTAARYFTTGSVVNVERSLRVGDRMGGHYVMGHVDQVMVLADKNQQDDFIVMTFSGISCDTANYFIPKGSVAVNGVSLTINRCDAASFTVMLIPHTLEKTNLNQLHVGDHVNIEYDWMVKTVVQQLKTREFIQ